MAEKFGFTVAALDSIQPSPDGKRIRVFDTRCPGLALYVSGAGGKVFYVYRWVKETGRPKEVKVGAYPDLTITNARDRARLILSQLALGQDPVAEERKARAEKTFSELFDWYMEKHSKDIKKSSERDLGNFNLHLQSLGCLRVSQITRTQIRELHQKIGKDSGKYAANRVLALIRVVFNRAIQFEEITIVNPAAGVASHTERSRERRLIASEVPRFFEAFEQHGSKDLWDFVCLSLFTGARRANVLAMNFDNIDLDGRTWVIPETKNGTPQTVPLEYLEIEILKRRSLAAKGSWVFPGKGKRVKHLTKPPVGWENVLKEAKITNLRFHDLRRSLGSWMIDTGASLPIVGKTLHHLSSKSTDVYARASLNPIREAKGKAIDAMVSHRMPSGPRSR